MADQTLAAPAQTYEVVVRRETPKDPQRRCGHEIERVPDIVVSAAAFTQVARRWPWSEGQRATWDGGTLAPADLRIGMLLCDPDPAVQAIGEELLPVGRWCVAHTALGDVCELLAVES